MFKSELGDRDLWFDGTTVVSPDKIIEYILSTGSSNVAVTHLSDEIKHYNRNSADKINVKEDLNFDLFPPVWTIPDHYKYLHIDNYLLDLVNKIPEDDLYEKRLERLAVEIALFKEHQLDNILKCLIYVIDEFRRRNEVWGVGRGSSCSSYILYLIGLHSVDPVLYDIEITDFLK